jgi:hypothetical protein
MSEKKKKKKSKPKVTLTKEYVEKLKRASMGYTILCQLLECSGGTATNKLCDLVDIERSLLQLPRFEAIGTTKDLNEEVLKFINKAIHTEVRLKKAFKGVSVDELLEDFESAKDDINELNKDLNNLLNMFGLKPSDYNSIQQKIEALATEAQVAANIAGKLADDGASGIEGPFTLASLMHKVRLVQDKRDRVNRAAIRLVEQRNSRLKKVLKSSLHTNAQLSTVMGIFEDDVNGTTD